MAKKKVIGIIGQGFVGTAVNEGLAKHYDIETYDIAKECTCFSIEELHFCVYQRQWKKAVNAI